LAGMNDIEPQNEQRRVWSQQGDESDDKTQTERTVGFLVSTWAVL